MAALRAGPPARPAGPRGDAAQPAVELRELAADRVDAEVRVLGAELDQGAAGAGDDELAAMAGLVGEAGVCLHAGEHGALRRAPDPGPVVPEPRFGGVVKDGEAGRRAAPRAAAVVIAASLPPRLAGARVRPAALADHVAARVRALGGEQRGRCGDQQRDRDRERAADPMRGVAGGSAILHLSLPLRSLLEPELARARGRLCGRRVVVRGRRLLNRRLVRLGRRGGRCGRRRWGRRRRRRRARGCGRPCRCRRRSGGHGFGFGFGRRPGRFGRRGGRAPAPRTVSALLAVASRAGTRPLRQARGPSADRPARRCTRRRRRRRSRGRHRRAGARALPGRAVRARRRSARGSAASPAAARPTLVQRIRERLTIQDKPAGANRAPSARLRPPAIVTRRS